MELDDCRRFYAEEIRFAANLDSPALVEAFARVPREDFLGLGPWQIATPNIRKALATGALPKLKSVRLDTHEQADTCILHREDVCLSSV